jgi:hypothetical protein
MKSATFIGEVRQGQLHIDQPLTDFNGKQVLVTLIVQDGSFSKAEKFQPGEVPPAELDVEVEVYEPMPAFTENLGLRQVRTVIANPCLIFPEATGDD